MTKQTDLKTIDIHRILNMLPHRYPFILLDRVIDIIPGEYGTGIKNVTINEQFFQGHFPQKPVMPGVLIVEAIAQTAAVLVVDFLGENSHQNIVYFMSIDKAKFRKPVEPGDQLLLKTKKLRSRGNVWEFRGEVFVKETLVAEAEVKAMIVNTPHV